MFDLILAALVAALVAIGPLAIATTKVVDLIRNLVDGGDRAPKWVWNVVSFAVGIAIAYGWDVNVLGPVAEAIPRLSGSGFLSGLGGDLLTGIVIGGAGGLWHDKFQQWSAAAAASRAVAVPARPIGTPGPRP